MEIIQEDNNNNDKRKRQKLNNDLSNLPTREVVLFLSDENLDVLKDFKKYCGYPFSDTLNALCKRNLDKFENIISFETLVWLESIYKFLDKDNYLKARNYIESYVEIDKKIGNKRGKHEDVHVYIEKNYLDIIDSSLKSYPIFTNWTRDKIITYLIALDDLRELDSSLREDIKLRYLYYKKQFKEYETAINDSFMKVNKDILADIFIKGFIYLPKLGLFIDYIKATIDILSTLKEENKIEKIKEFEDVLNDVQLSLNNSIMNGMLEHLKKINDDNYIEIKSKLYIINKQISKLREMV